MSPLFINYNKADCDEDLKNDDNLAFDHEDSLMAYRKLSRSELQQAIEHTKVAHSAIVRCLDELPEPPLTKALKLLEHELPELLDDIEADLDKLTRALHRTDDDIEVDIDGSDDDKEDSKKSNNTEDAA